MRRVAPSADGKGAIGADMVEANVGGLAAEAPHRTASDLHSENGHGLVVDGAEINRLAIRRPNRGSRAQWERQRSRHTAGGGNEIEVRIYLLPDHLPLGCGEEGDGRTIGRPAGVRDVVGGGTKQAHVAGLQVE